MNKRKLFGMAAMMTLSGTLLTACGTSNQSPSSSNGAGSTSQSGKSKETITLGYVDWAEDVADVYLWKQLLESKGYNVDAKLMEAGPLFEALSSGSIDVHFDVWLPTTDKAYMQRYQSTLTDLGKWYQGQTKLGLVVPDYVNIDSLSQLNAHAQEFGNQIIGIDPGAGETQTIQQTVIPDYNLSLKLVNSSETAMLAQLQKDYNEKQPVVVVLWSPHWAFSKWHLKYLKDPKGSFGKAGWIQTEANKKWAQSNPTVAKWLKNFKLNQQQLGSLENDINTASSKEAGVKKWISANQSLVNSWFQSS